jgi:hypothetical protein
MNRRIKQLSSLLFTVAAVIALAVIISGTSAFGQATAVNGSIQGVITDPSGAAVPKAAVKIVSNDTGVTRTLNTNDSGFYASGPLIPGSYTIDVVAQGFSEVKSSTIVQIGSATNGNLKLSIAKGSEIVMVNSGTVQVNTEQSSVSDVLTTQQIESLPVNGRNFLDLAQLEPGVQLQSGQSFDPTKAGYSAISFSGISGRTTRILLDGQDVTDETVGTTILNVSAGAIDQFQMNRANSDVSGEIGSSGQVMVSTRSGTNSFHGEAFGNFQDSRAGFASFLGLNSPFQRNQFGGSVGGPILRDKLFFFANAERIKQDESSTVQMGNLFSGIRDAHPTIPAPYKLTYSTGRMDYNGPAGIHYFGRVAYDVDAVVGNFGNGYSNYANRDNTPAYAFGADFVHGKLTHSLRTSYEKFHNMIGDATQSGVYLAVPDILIRYASQGLYTGPNVNAPQSTFQSNKQYRYDGSWTKSAHNVRYGVSLNRILQGGMASFFGLGPRLSLNATSWIGEGTMPTSGLGPDDLLNDFNAQVGVRMGNGLGYFTNTPEFGQPAGGSRDWRVGLYVADSWKVAPRLTVNAGIRYQRDTGRTDNALDPIPCSEINSDIFPNAPCSGTELILDQFGAGLGKRIVQPNWDFAPQAGFTYSLDSSSKTVLRGGVGVFRENNVFNAVQFDTPFKLKSGLFNDYSQILCAGTYSLSIPGVGAVTTYNGESISAICAQPLAQSAAKFAGLQADYQAGSAAAGAAANGSFIGNRLAIPGGNSAYAPDYKTPYSININIGVQRQLGSGMVFTADYVRQVTYHIAQQLDANHVGDADYLNVAAANLAVASVLDDYEAANIDDAIADGATLGDFSDMGLDSGNVYLGGYPASYYGITPDEGAAFPGKNANVGNGYFSFPAGKSAYNALQANLRQQKANPVRGISDSNLTVSYTFSSFRTNCSAASDYGGGSDPFFACNAWDMKNPSKNWGYGGLDHRHNLAFGGSFTVTHGPEIGVIAHFLSSAATSLLLDNLSGDAGQIFTTNLSGDGTSLFFPTGGTGSYSRGIKGSGLKKTIDAFNQQYAGTLTPAGKAVVNAGILTESQMAAIGAVIQPIAAPPSNPYENPMFRSVDLSLTYPIKLKFISETATIKPVIAFYNAFNMANFSGGTTTGGPDGHLLNEADAGAEGYANGPNDFSIRNANRTGRGSGTYAQGAPRSIEFQLKFSF